MKTMLVTGGTVFVSRYIAEYYVAARWRVYVLNRNRRAQSAGVQLIEADRHALGDRLRGERFDAVIDTAYTKRDVDDLMDALGEFGAYVLISSSAVYPEYSAQPFTEDTPLGENRFWGRYGTDKIEAEATVRTRCPHAYILRPPYLYGPMNNVYREAFVFDCAMAGRPFYLPRDGEMPLQFFHVHDLCRMIDALLEGTPEERIYNVGNRHTVSVREWITLCYEAVGASPQLIHVYDRTEQRNYFPFYDYAYRLEVSRQQALLCEEIPLAQGLQDALAWYKEHADEVSRKPFLSYIDSHFR